MMKVIEIEGKPIPLLRARAGKKGFYDPQLVAKRNFAYLVKEKFKREPIATGISLVLEFYFPMPKSWSKKKKNRMAYKEHTQTPDTSNLIKFVEDALNEVVWEDDKLIFDLHAKKTWAEKGSTIIEIKAIE